MCVLSLVTRQERHRNHVVHTPWQPKAGGPGVTRKRRFLLSSLAAKDMLDVIRKIAGFRRTIMVSVLLALCFSAGEGLRLMPFPEETAIEITPVQTEASWESDPVQYGPVDLPQTSAAKHQFKIVRLHSLNAAKSTEPPTSTAKNILRTEVVTIPSGPSICQSRDRAPPKHS